MSDDRDDFVIRQLSARNDKLVQLLGGVNDKNRELSTRLREQALSHRSYVEETTKKIIEFQHETAKRNDQLVAETEKVLKRDLKYEALGNLYFWILGFLIGWAAFGS